MAVMISVVKVNYDEIAAGRREQGMTALTDFGIENLKELIETHKADPAIMELYRKA